MISTAPAPSVVPEKNEAEWFTPWRFAALLGVLILACFPQVITGLETFFFRDYDVFGYPLASYHRQSFWRGEMPLWNPLNNCGLPFTAQWNTLTLYPLSLFYLLFPLSWSLGVFCLGHLFFAGMGMYFLARRWTGNSLAGAVAGTAFAYNGLTWTSLMWPNNIAALGWMPWVVLIVEQAWREGGRRIIVAALVGVMQMLAGAPEIILQTWLLLGVLWLVQWFRRDAPRAKMIMRAFSVCALVAALAAAQLLPFLDLLHYSHRDTSFGHSLWPMPATGLANYLVPLFHCFHYKWGVYLQHDQYWTSSYFLGVGIIALALLAVWRARNWRVWFLAALTFFSLAMAMGNNGFLFIVLKKILPQIGFMRFPIKFVVLATFTLPLLAAHGLAWLRALPAENVRREWKRTAVLAGVLVVLMAGIVWLAAKHPQKGDDLRMTIESGARSVAFLAMILGCIAWIHRRPERRAQMVLQSSLMVLVWFDVFTHVPTLSPTIPRRVFDSDQIRVYWKWENELQPGQSRVMQSQSSNFKLDFGAVSNRIDDVYGARMTLFENLNLLDDVPKVDGFYSLYLRQMNDIVDWLYHRATNDLPNLKDYMNVSHTSSATNEMEWTVRPTFMPLVTGGQRPVFLDDSTALGMLVLNPGFDGRKVICLPPEAKTVIHATTNEDVKITPPNFSAQRIVFEVDTPAPAMISVAQAYYHPWHAYVDGTPTKVWRANYAFQALESPAGKHKVELVYEDAMFRAGCWISLAALLACGVAWFLCRKRVV